MSTKVLTGSFKGRPLFTPPQARPTKAMVREALMNRLRFVIPETRFLDLFAGSGAMGIEALSNDALFTVFVENHPESIEAIEKNRHSFEIEDQTDLLQKDVLDALEDLKEKEPFDFIFADPPYQENWAPQILEKIAQLSLLKKEGSLFIEESTRADLPESVGPLSLVKKKIYGETQLLEYRAI